MPDEETVSLDSAPDVVHGNRHLWGLWDVYFDRDTLTLDAVPLRSTQYSLNVTYYLHPPWPNPDCIQFEIVDTPIAYDYIDIIVDVHLSHPFPGLMEYTGFDVRGIFIHNGYYTDNLNPNLKYSYMSDGVTALMNPDGYTRWWNPAEFSGSPDSVLGYYPGEFGNDLDWTGTVNAFKYYQDNVEAETDIVEFYGDEVNLPHRAVFNAGSTNTRRYEIRFFYNDYINIEFQYAIDATWVETGPDYSGDPAEWDIPDDFPPEANLYEPILIDCPEVMRGYPNNYEPATFDIEVFSWDAVNDPDGILDIKRISISTPTWDDPFNADTNVTGIDLDNCRIEGSGGPISSVWRIDLNSFGPFYDGVFPVLVAVEPDPQVHYDEIVGDHAPSGAVAAYDIFFIDSYGYSPSDTPEEFSIRACPTTVQPDEPIEFEIFCDYFIFDVEWFWTNTEIPDLITDAGEELVEISWPVENAFDLHAKISNLGGTFEKWFGPIPITISTDCVPPTTTMWPDFPWSLKVGYSVMFYAGWTQGSGPLTFDWDWGDGNGYSETTEEPEVEHYFNQTGVFMVSVRANNPCGSDELDEPVQITVKEY